MELRNGKLPGSTNVRPMFVVERLRRRDRRGDAWEREPWNANVLNRSTRFEPAANEPPPEVA
jgi:hypothetical protein